VNAINEDKWDRDCSGPGQSGSDGPCGPRGNSGPHDETLTNPGGNDLPGQQPDEPR
jgi:hypothetical protein